MKNRYRQAIVLVLWVGMALGMGCFSSLPGETKKTSPATPPEYEIGGPLAGVKLPLYKTQHGEKPGYPGCIPELIAQGKEVVDMGKVYREWDAQGQMPELELYPGTVEHWRHCFFKYVNARSPFDRQSQIKDFVAPAIPGATGAEQYAAPVYWVPRHDAIRDTGKRLAPVPVIRMKVKNPVFKFDLGELSHGLYAVRVIGAVPTEKLRLFRDPLFITLRINDGLKGEISTYRFRANYCDEFYSVAEIYFHAPEKRAFTAELFIDEGSKVELLVHNITLDDALAGTVRRPLKKRRTLTTEADVLAAKKEFAELEKQLGALPPPLSSEERLTRDELIWKWRPPLNAQGAANQNGFPKRVSFGVGDKTAEQIESEFGKWEFGGWGGSLNPNSGCSLSRDPKWQRFFMENKKLGLQYTVDDLVARKPLPDPYPYKDEGSGIYTPDPGNPENVKVWCPIAKAVSGRIGAPIATGMGGYRSGVWWWLAAGNREFARDAAVNLISFAYQFPSIDDANDLRGMVTAGGHFHRRDCQDDYTVSHSLVKLMRSYDALFDFIQGNQELATSIGRFVPWVKKPEDVIQLLDVYLVQTGAKRLMRFQDLWEGMAIVPVAATLGEPSVADAWMDWFLERSFLYPFPPEGMQSLLITGTDRHGCEYTGSTEYAQPGLGGENAFSIGGNLDQYISAGGNARFDLNQSSFKPLAQCYWQLNTVVGGQDFLRIGDVNGPDKRLGTTMGNLQVISLWGWKWASDPIFAWMVKYFAKPKGETPESWAKIDAAAAKAGRAPWLDLRSRSLDNWAAILETGHQHDDYRFRRAAYLRTGVGQAHAHLDVLDLQVVAHGLPMTIDGGQRGGYSKPNDRTLRTHNTVEVDQHAGVGKSLSAYAWTQSLCDLPGARYLQASALPPPESKLFRRQIALIDVDEGQGSQRLSPEQQLPNAKLAAASATAKSYVFDVFRVSGGKLHTYGFHGPVNDEFTINASNRKLVEPVPAGKEGADPEADYLAMFNWPDGKKFAGDAPDLLQATWRYQREGTGSGSEKFMAGPNFDPASPRKFTRLHLFNTSGCRALNAEVACTHSPIIYNFTHLMVQKKESESAFTAVIEPYSGEPFIVGQKSLEISDNETDALRAVAVEVKTKNGRTDVCFADGRPERTREFQVQSSKFQVAGEFAYYSQDAQGFRAASLGGGTLLSGPGARLQLAQRELTGKVVAVDYAKRILKIDQAWPAMLTGVFEIGAPEHWASYTAESVAKEGAESVIRVSQGADCYRSNIEQVSGSTVQTRLDLGPGLRDLKSWVASNDQQTKFWRATADSATMRFTLAGEPVSEANFKPSGALRLWEYGVGDTVRKSAGTSVRRVAENCYEVFNDLDLTVSLKVKKFEVSTDQTTWKALAAKPSGDWLEAMIPSNPVGGSPLFLRVAR